MVLLTIIPIKWLFHWEYTLFSDKPISVAFPCSKEALRSQSMYLCYVFSLDSLDSDHDDDHDAGYVFPLAVIMMMILMQVIMMMVIMMFAAAAADDDDDDDTELGSRFHGQGELCNIPGFIEIYVFVVWFLFSSIETMCYSNLHL